MYQLFQDSMAICRENTKPQWFVTATANPKWPEIQRELLPGQSAEDRPDLVARVFALKMKFLREDLLKNGHMGKSVAHVYTIEFQKRGLPHMHLLIFIHKDDQVKTPADVDKYVSAEIPDKEREPALWNIVTKSMMHGPCGVHNPDAPCMVNGKCSKHFPKAFEPETKMDGNGYPTYRRRDNGRTVEKRGKYGPVLLDNRWVVPYNPGLLVEYECHINTECCASVHSVKYIHKYVYKGHDRATLEVGKPVDEIKQYLDARWIGTSEAVWRLMLNHMHQEIPAVYRLQVSTVFYCHSKLVSKLFTFQVHLPGQHMVVFDPDQPPELVAERAASQKTMLTAFFAANRKYEHARQWLYQEFPQHFTYKKKPPEWKPRQRSTAIGRLYFAAPVSGERFYLRTLLTVVRGPMSFEDLRTVNGVLCPTFKDACIQRGLLEDDGEWIQCLEEAAVMHTGSRLRALFATMLLHCVPTDPLNLWERFRANICDDLERRLQRDYAIAHPTEEQVYDFGLYLLQEILHQSGTSLEKFPPMPIPQMHWADVQQNRCQAL